jgi:hypothetical protein
MGSGYIEGDERDFVVNSKEDEKSEVGQATSSIK